MASASRVIGRADCEPLPATDGAGMTIGAELAQIRLAHRAARLEALLSMLRLRSAAYGLTARTVPRALRGAIAGFDEELSAVRDRLEHARGRSPDLLT